MLRLYRIRFLSRATPIRAYTLFGAICWSYRLMGWDVEELCKRFENNPPFLISSPFPIVAVEVEGEKRNKVKELPLLPKPILPIANSFRREDNLCLKVNRKPVKKAEYITPEALKKLIESKELEERTFYKSDFEMPEESKAKFIALKEEKIGRVLFKTKGSMSVRNMLNRETMKSEQLLTENFYYYPDMYFLIKYLDKEIESQIKACIELIEDNGLGANKNIGWGSVKIEESTNSFKTFLDFIDRRLVVNNDELFMTLSPMLPTKGSIEFSYSYYKVEPYKAPVDTTFGENFIWKRKVLYLTEGSTIKPTGDRFVGCIKTVSTLNVRAYQYGFEFPICLEG